MAVHPVQINFPCIRSVAEVMRQSTCKKSSKQSNGRRIYLSSREKPPPRDVLQNIRLRWNVENKNHHHRDATFLEDKCRCRTRNTAANLALMRGAVLTIWKITRPSLPAPAFVSRNQRKLDAMIELMTKNQRLRKMQ
jgi:predicted transposase YbfD/YdcC